MLPADGWAGGDRARAYNHEAREAGGAADALSAEAEKSVWHGPGTFGNSGRHHQTD